MNDNDLQDATALTGSVADSGRTREIESAITPPANSGALVAGGESVVTAAPGSGEPLPPPLVALIAITSPQDGAQIVGPGSGVPIILNGTYGAGDVGITVNISVKVSPRSSRTTYEFGVTIIDTNNWTSSFNTPEGGDLQVEAVLTVSSDDGRSRTVGNSILLLTNTTPPVFSVDHTSAHTDISGNWFATVNDSQSITIQVSGKASDPQFGIKEVVWILDGGTPNVATTTDNWANWSANVPIQLGIHSLTFRCTDIGGNKAEFTYQVTIARSVSIFSITPQDYLKALLLFATDPVISKAGQSQFVSRITIAGQNLTEKNLADAFYQPFGDLTLDTKQAKANEQVHQVRLCIEVLRSYLTALSKPIQSGLAGYWKFDEGLGTTTADASDNHLDGTLQGATWASGQLGSSLLFNGSSAYVQVGNAPLLKMTNALSIAAWIHPTGPGTPDQGGTIVNKEGEYEIARFPDGSIRWAIANTSPGWTWINTEYIAPPNQWTHIVVAYDGGTVKTYANGQQEHAFPASGPIGSADPNNHDFRIGGRQLTAQFFQGRIDEVKVFSRALGAQEVLAVFAEAPLEAAQSAYLQAAYTALLVEVGTSYDEIRLARGEAQDKRRALADQLGIDLGDTRPDHLDALFLAPSAITEASLEQIFGLVDTTRDPLSSPPLPNLQDWRIKHLETLWQGQDFPDSASTVISPLIDPDMLIASDFKNPLNTDPAFQLYTSRQTLLQSWFDALQQQHQTGSSLDAILSGTLNRTSADLLALDQDRRSGNDIKPQLETMNLALDAFNYLVRVSRLVQKNQPLLESEWSDVFSILVQVKKRGVFKAWWDAEKAANITQSPAYFQISHDPVQLDPWRATEEARNTWQATLQGRIDQQNSIIEELQAAIDAAEEASLMLMRDALVSAIGDVVTAAVGNLPANWNPWDWLTELLLIDVKGTSLLKTTRVRQAIETLQSIFFSLRASRFEKMLPKPGQVSSNLNAWVLNGDKSQFDQEWAWMGSYANWQAAMRVFCYPENLLLPTLREDSNPTQKPTKAFNDLVDQLRNAASLTPADARAAATQYLKDLGTQPGLPQTITEKLDEAGLLALQSQITNAFSPYVEGTPPHFKSPPPVYLQEVYYFVPMQLALELEHAGQFESALDWLRTVYAYNLSELNEPRIYFGLAVDQHTQTSYLQTPHWLIDSLNPHTIATKRANSFTSFTLMSIVRCFLDFADAEFTTDSSESLPRALALYLGVLDLFALPELQPPTTDSNSSNQMAPNPIFLALKMHAELNLRKLRSGRNIAGMQRQVDVNLSPDGTLIGSPTVGNGTALATPGTLSLQPTPYRYSALIERAKQLVALAQQMETSYLAALEKKDVETYTLLRAQQDLGLANANVNLQNLRVDEASDGVTLASYQQERTQIQIRHYNDLINSDISELELLSLAFQGTEASMQFASGLLYTAAAIEGSFSAQGIFTWGANTTQGIAQGLSSFAAATGTLASVLAARASYEEKQKDWQFQLDMAKQDSIISDQQYTLAIDHQKIVAQEQANARLQVQHAHATVDFLATKFTNAELYAWMSGVLSGVYSYFLQQATAIARLAQNQLVFERQEAPLSFIQANYWQSPSNIGESSSTNSQTPDRRGLTGSARLLQDIYQLDQYAFLTNSRKLQLVKTISLASVAPFEFQRFRETGVLPFATPTELFDRDFPGHYLRLIKRVRTSVIALIPPTQGIRATLSNTGVSRATIGGDVFRDVVVRRDPESIALSSPINATGLFELDTQPDMLLPFEGLGVDTSWQFEMPKAANPFDYDTIADVLIAMEYTALHSNDLRQQVIQQLDRQTSGDRAYRFSQEFADAWYELNNPDQSSTPMTVQFETKREDFPPNIEDLTITQLVLYFVPKDTTPIDQIAVSNLSLKQGADTIDGGGADTKEGVISTRRGNAASWASSLCNTKKSPDGVWTLVLPNTNDLKKHFANEDIKDILFVITYSGQTPKWP